MEGVRGVGTTTLLTPKLLLDEDIHGPAAAGLRARGVDVLRVQEAGTQGDNDEKQLALAVRLERTMVTFNRGDYARLHKEYMLSGRHHCGIIVSRQMPPGELIKHVLLLLKSKPDLPDSLHFL